MTSGHTHRVIRAREGSLVERLLCGPVIARSTDLARVERSRWVWLPEVQARTSRTPQPDVYVLRPLGVLHGLFGLTLDIVDDQVEDEPEKNPK